MARTTLQSTITSWLTLVSLASFGPSLLAQSRDSLGLDVEPVCDDADIVMPAYVDEPKALPLGLKSKNEKWNMELFANAQSGEWVLLGRSRSPKADRNEVCVLANGKKPYRAEKWFQAHFK